MHLLALERQPTLMAGGQERSLFEALAGLREQGVAVTLAYEIDGELLREYSSLGCDVLKIPGRRIQLKPARTALHSLGNALASLGRLWTRQRRAKFKWNLIYVNQYTDLPLAVVAGRLLGLPVICHLRLPAHPCIGRQDRWGLLQADRLIAISKNTKDSYVRVGIPEDKIDVIYNAIDTSRFVYQSNRGGHEDKQLVYIGRITSEKGLPVLIEAFKAVRARRRDVSLHIYGDDRFGSHPGSHLLALRRQAGDMLDREIVFHGHVVDTVPILQSADVVILPSIWDEAFGRIVIEAMACGTPVIGSRIGGIPEILEPRFPQLLVPPGDSEALAERIEHLVDWRQRYPQLGEQCRRLVVEQFDKGRLINDLRGVLGKVVARVD